MAHPILMPKAGQSMIEGKIVSWLKKEGDEIEEGEPILEIETDKANLEVEAPSSGVLRQVLATEGETCGVLTMIGVIGEPGEEFDVEALKKELPAAPEAGAATDDLDEPVSAAPSAAAPAGPLPAEPAPPPTAPQVAAAAVAVALAPSNATAAPRAVAGGRAFASPLARKIARQRGVDLGSMRGSGPGGRILRRDVEAAPAQGPAGPSAGAMAAPPSMAAKPYPPPSPRPAASVAMEGMRKAIGTALQQSKQVIPHFYATVPIDVTSALALKSALKEQGLKVSVNDLVVRACVLCLLDEPRVNCRVYPDRIEYPADVNVGVAVGQEHGLVVPVIQKAQSRDLPGIAEESRRIVTAANSGKLIGSGKGTFTVSNLGMFGVESFTAIINPPEGAILAVGAVATEVVPCMGGLLPRSILRVTLSSDHRAVDGVVAARFLQRLKHVLENPDRL